MLSICALPADTFLTGPFPRSTVLRGLSPQEVAAMQRDVRVCRAAIAKSRQRCSGARDLLAVATERLVCSRHFLDTGQ